LSFRGAPVSGGASEEVLQIGNSEQSMPEPPSAQRDHAAARHISRDGQ
jgi:hypothetical protein